MVLRLITNPIGHPIFTALCAVGVFVFVARLRSGVNIRKALLGLPLVMWLLAVLNHAFWNDWQFGVVSSLGYLGIVLSIFVIVVPFLIILRDFLGGHFNFGKFFETIPEPPPPIPPMPTDAPPPPSPIQAVSNKIQKTDVKPQYSLGTIEQKSESENACVLC